MASTTLPIQNIMVLGASGNIGREILRALQDHNTANPSSVFNITILTRTASYERTLQQILPSTNLHTLAIDSYTDTTTLTSLLQTHSIQALISTVASFSTNDQQRIIDACVASGTVRRFIPSEYGVDTSNRALVEKHLPLAVLKLETVEYLRRISAETNKRLTWSAVIVGTFFDWGLVLPNVMGFDISNNRVMLFDGGEVKYEATNVAQIARTVVTCLATAEAFDSSADQYVYVNSFTTTQNEVVGLIEKYTGKSMEQVAVDSVELSRKGKELMESVGGLDGYRAYQPTAEVPYAPGSGESIWACLYGGEKMGGLNQYSFREPGLWNEKLGLPKESIEDTVRGVVEKLGMLKSGL